MGQPESVQNQDQGGTPRPSHQAVTSNEAKNNHQPKEAEEVNMSDTTETNGTTPTNGVTPQPMKPEPSGFQDQLRAVTKERSRLSQRVQELEPLQAEVQSLQSKLNEANTRYTQDMHLVELGINSERARRAIRREYREEVAEMQGDDRPEFASFVGSLRQDAFYGKLFDGQEGDTPAPQPAPQRRAMTTDPNAGADQPKDPTRPLDANSYKSIKSRAERLALARKHGFIK